MSDAETTTMTEIRPLETVAPPTDIETGLPSYTANAADNRLERILNRRNATLPIRWRRTVTFDDQPKYTNADQTVFTRPGRISGFFKNLKDRVKSKPSAETLESSDNQRDGVGRQLVPGELDIISDAPIDGQFQGDVSSLGQIKTWWKRFWALK